MYRVRGSSFSSSGFGLGYLGSKLRFGMYGLRIGVLRLRDWRLGYGLAFINLLFGFRMHKGLRFHVGGLDLTFSISKYVN